MKKSKEQKSILQSKSKENHVCNVCLTQNPQEKTKTARPKQVQSQRKKCLELHSCITCKATVHKYCYDPSLHQTKNWKCDFCKQQKAKNVKQECFICKVEGKMLKYVDDNKFAHVHCALSSDMIILENFKTLKFKMNSQFKSKQTTKDSKQKSKQKQGNSKYMCMYCRKDSTQGLFKCFKQDCNFTAHISCILQHKYFYSGQDDIVYNLLNQSMGSFRVKNYDFLKKNFQTLKAIEMLQKPKKVIQYITCNPHSADLKWCSICCKTEPTLAMNQCCRCYRWVHTQCSKMKNKSQNAYFECDACFKDEIYMQRALLPQQINRLVKIQTSSNKLTYDEIKYLDSFAFKSSTQIYNQILKNKIQFQWYHLYRYLQNQFLKHFEYTKEKKDQKRIEPVEKILQRISVKDLKDFNNKKIVEILYFLKHRDIKTKNQLNTANDINDLRSVYPKVQGKHIKINSLQASQQQKCKKILDKFLDLYIKNMKQAQLKDVSMKLVQFSDNIRKQIANIKDNSLSALQIKKLKRSDSVSLIQNLKKRPYRIAMDLRQMLKMIGQNRDKLKGKFQLQNNQDNQNNQSDSNIKADSNLVKSDSNLVKSSKSNKKNQSLQTNSLLMTLFRCITSKNQGFQSQSIQLEDLMDIIDNYRKIVYVSRIINKKIPRKITLSEQQLYKITNKSYNLNKTKLSEQSQVKIAKFFKSLLKQNNIKDSYQMKTQLAEKYDVMIQDEHLTYKQAQAIKQNMAEQGLFLDKHSKMMNIQKRSIYFKVLKIKYMKIVKLQLENQNITQFFPLKPIEKSRKQIIRNVQLLLGTNDKSIKLTEQQKQILEYFLVKEEVFTNIFKEEAVLGSKLDAYNSYIVNQSTKIQAQGEQTQKKTQTNQGQNNVDMDKNMVSKGQITILQRIKRIFSYWMQNCLQNPYQIIKILYPIAERKIKFPIDYQTAFNDIIESIGSRMDLYFKCEDQAYGQNLKVNSDQFMKLWKLIEYAQLQNAFEKLKNLSQEYNDWLKDLQHRYNPIAKVLEDQFLNKQLLDIIDRKISQAERFQIDLKTQIRKLKTVKLWAVLSDRFQKDFDRKPTINAIQQFKSYLIKIHYPHNVIFQKVLQLQNYGRQLNERIQKFLKRQKYEDLQFHEQMYMIKLKMSLKQAQQLKNQLQNSKLDVSAQLQTLQQQLISFNQIPSKLQPYLKKNDNLDQLIKIKANILQSPIRYQSLDSFCQLYHRINFLKCQNLDGNINKKQFLRLLSTSQLGAIILTEKYPQLLKAYKDIQKAEKQILSIKPRFQYLLPLDGKKLKLELQKDPSTLQQIQRIYQKVQSLRDKFKTFKVTKQYYERYIILENQLSRLPVIYKDVQIEIHKMKNQIDILVDKSMFLKKNFNPKQASQLVRMYSRIGMKHNDVEAIKKIYQAYSICMSFSERQQDYPQFSHKCREYSQLQSIITLNQTRNQLFGQYSQELLQQKAQANQQNKVKVSLLNALLHQGSFLLHHVIDSSKHNCSVRQKTLTTLLKINQKLQEITKSSNSIGKTKKSYKIQNGGEQYQDGQQNGYNSGNSDQDQSQGMDDDGFVDQNDDQMDYDQDEDQMDDYDDYDDQQDSVPQPPKKRAQPLVMQISDEQNQPVPDPRKVSHLNPAQAAGDTLKQVNEIIEQSQQAQNINQS